MMFNKSSLFILMGCFIIASSSGGQVEVIRSSSQLKTITKPTSVRTELKVSRSLDPDKTQSIQVKSNTGGLATIIVKKRDGKSSNIPRVSAIYNIDNSISRDESQRAYRPSSTLLERVSTEQNNFQNSQFGSWEPVQTQSGNFRFADHDVESQKSIQVINSFMKHIGQIEAEARQIQDETGIRNDRSPVHIDVASTTVDEKTHKVPTPVFIRSEPVYIKDVNKEKRGRSIMSVDSDGIPVIHGIRVPDDEDDKKKTWRNARVINGELVPYENGYVPKKAEFDYGQLVFAKKSPESYRSNIGPFMKEDNFERVDLPKSLGPFTVDDNKKPDYNSYYKSNYQSDESGIGPFSITDNARIENSKLVDYIKKINDREARRDYFVAKPQVRFPDHTPQIQRRMLQNPGNPVFAPSRIYSPQKQQSLAYSSEPSRTPVLEYAHPELGVQPAKLAPAETITERKVNTKVQYYSSDVHNDRSPYAIEPAMNTNSFYKEPAPKIHNDRYYTQTPIAQMTHNSEYPFKNPATYPYNYGYLRRVKEQPLWMKLTEQMRDSFQNSFATVQEMTRPVIDPIVEAGQKISVNLGFSRNQEAQDKVGVIPAAGTLLPALAGAAALGLAGMAVGRFFDANMLKRSSDEETFNAINMEHKRTIEAIQKEPGNYYVLMQQDGDRIRSRRSTNDFGIFDESQGEDLIRVKRKESSIPDDILSDFEEYKNDKFDHGETLEVYEITRDDKNEGVDQSVNKDSSRRKRSIYIAEDESLRSILQDIERDHPVAGKVGFEQQIRNTDWSNTPCAKKVFCEVMIQQSDDDILLMEKKMDTLLNMMRHPTLSFSLSHHLFEVTDAIRRRDCSPFVCFQR